jgi:hypothetical protein
MAVTSNTYTGDGSNKLFSITFPYLDTSDIDVSLNGSLQTITTQYTFANATTIEFVTAPAIGAVVLLNRSTDDTALQATFFPGSSIRANDLNDNFDQILYLTQETVNSAANQSTAGLQVQITAANNAANIAVSTANTADATANGISATANTALTNANTAVSTANSANTTANTALTTANAISTTANTALTNSNTATTTANTAQTTANTAQTTANTANTTANAALPKAGGTMTGNISFLGTQPRVARVRVNFNGIGTVAIRDSLNISSITDVNTGLYTVNFTNALVDANYSAFCSVRSAESTSITQANRLICGLITYTTGSITMLVTETGSTDTFRDSIYNNVVIFD